MYLTTDDFLISLQDIRLRLIQQHLYQRKRLPESLWYPVG